MPPFSDVPHLAPEPPDDMPDESDVIVKITVGKRADAADLFKMRCFQVCTTTRVLC